MKSLDFNADFGNLHPSSHHDMPEHAACVWQPASIQSRYSQRKRLGRCHEQAQQQAAGEAGAAEGEGQREHAGADRRVAERGNGGEGGGAALLVG